MKRLAYDEDGHWYVIPAEAASLFDHWLASEEAGMGDDPPKWAVAIDSPTRITFSSYEID